MRDGLIQEYKDETNVDIIYLFIYQQTKTIN